MCSPIEKRIGDQQLASNDIQNCPEWKRYNIANLFTADTKAYFSNEETRGKKRKWREYTKIHPELIKSNIPDKHRFDDTWKDEIEKILLWPKKVKEAKIKRKEKRREKKDNEISKDND